MLRILIVCVLWVSLAGCSGVQVRTVVKTELVEKPVYVVKEKVYLGVSCDVGFVDVLWSSCDSMYCLDNVSANKFLFNMDLLRACLSDYRRFYDRVCLDNSTRCVDGK